MPLQKKLEAISRKFKEDVAPTLPEETLEAMEAFQQRVAAKGLEDNALKPGERFPDFLLPDGHGAEFSLHGVLAQGPAVVFFFRGKW